MKRKIKALLLATICLASASAQTEEAEEWLHMGDSLYDCGKLEQAVKLYRKAAEAGIDEAQFFGENLAAVCQALANRGVRVIAAGLDTDYLGKPFGPIPALMAIAEDVQKVHAICVKCGGLANHSHRLSKSRKLVVLGEKDIYEPLCRECFNKALAED